MKTTIVARKMDLTSGMKEYVEKKLSKLDKFFDDDAEAKITKPNFANSDGCMVIPPIPIQRVAP